MDTPSSHEPSHRTFVAFATSVAVALYVAQTVHILNLVPDLFQMLLFGAIVGVGVLGTVGLAFRTPGTLRIDHREPAPAVTGLRARTNSSGPEPMAA